MKLYKLRFILANALIVVSALALSVRLLFWFVPVYSAAEAWLIPLLFVLVSVCALAFGILEAVTIYRAWVAAAIEEEKEPPSEI